MQPCMHAHYHQPRSYLQDEDEEEEEEEEEGEQAM